MRVGPCIPAGVQLWKAEVAQLLGRHDVFLTCARRVCSAEIWLRSECEPTSFVSGLGTWEKQVLSARGFKRVGRHPEYSIYTVCRCVGRGPGGSSEPPGSRICFSPLGTAALVELFQPRGARGSRGKG
jgi:hypothetical protein